MTICVLSRDTYTTQATWCWSSCIKSPACRSPPKSMWLWRRMSPNENDSTNGRERNLLIERERRGDQSTRTRRSLLYKKTGGASYKQEESEQARASGHRGKKEEQQGTHVRHDHRLTRRGGEKRRRRRLRERWEERHKRPHTHAHKKKQQKASKGKEER